MSEMSPVTLFQAISSTSSITTPIMRVESSSNHTLFVHYTEQTHTMMFHWLNVLPNTTNTEFIQYGWRDIRFGSNVHCETFSFTRVSIEKVTIKLPDPVQKLHSSHSEVRNLEIDIFDPTPPIMKIKVYGIKNICIIKIPQPR